MRLHNMYYSVLISPSESEIITALNKYGVETFFTRPVEKLISYEQYHADIQLLIIKSNGFICANSAYLADIINKFSIKPVVCEAIEGKYPHNVLLNAALIGNKLICKESSLSKIVKSYCESECIEIINVKQGYSKCSTLILDENSLITADKGIYKKSVDNGIETLLIRPGYIELKGTDYGFIGGCSGVIGDTVVFFGDVNTHPDADIMFKFIKERGLNIVSLLNGPLKDIGGIVQLNK